MNGDEPARSMPDADKMELTCKKPRGTGELSRAESFNMGSELPVHDELFGKKVVSKWNRFDASKVEPNRVQVIAGGNKSVQAHD